MGAVSAAARELLAVGVTGDALVTALERIEEACKPVRSAAADRMVRYRQRKQEASEASPVTHGDAVSPPKEIPPTPPKEITPPSSLRSDSSTKRARATRIPEDFEPNVEEAIAGGVERTRAENEAAIFKNYWLGKSGTNATKHDWKATWRVWWRKALSDPNGRSRAPPPRYPPRGNGFASMVLDYAEQQHERTSQDNPPRPAGTGFTRSRDGEEVGVLDAE